MSENLDLPDNHPPDRNDEPRWNREVLALAEAVVNDDATPDQVRRLDALLTSDESARSLYLHYLNVHAGLRRRYLSPKPESEGPASIKPAPAPHRRHLWIYAAVAVAASVAAMILRPDPPRLAGDDAAQPEPALHASIHGVAVLSRLVDVEWSSGVPRYEQGAPVPAGLLAIESGVVQLDFYCGAIAVLEGPAKLDLKSAVNAALLEGKLRARVPMRARGFTIVTTSGDIVDLGTEFAVEAPRGDAPGQLHVIDGDVRYHPRTEEGATPVSLGSHDAMWLRGEGLGAEVAAAPPTLEGQRFIGPTEVETLARRASTARRRVWATQRERLLEDPDLVALYGYSPEPEWSRLFRNLAPGAEADSHGAVIGCEWVEGRWPGHKALRFQNASHRVSVSLPGEFDSLTLATWVAVDRFHPTNRVALMHPERDQDRVLFWTLAPVPSGAVLHFAESSQPWRLADRRHYSSRNQGMFTKDLGKWVHLAVVYDADRRRLSHYRNGQLVRGQPIDAPRKLSIGIADLGNWPYKDWAKGTEFEMRNLMGRMDEFVVLGRALSDQEIERMHEAGAP